jgi:NAD(P)-dependent dehydrogenase (short-subunit alcohol dehydrogenase family)
MKKKALVLGASSGIGAAVSDFLDERGWEVVGIGGRELDKWVTSEAVKKDRIDLSDFSSFRSYLDQEFNNENFPNLVINTVGRSSSRPLIQCKSEDFEIVFSQNLNTPLVVQNEIVKQATLRKVTITSIMLSSMSTNVVMVGNSLYAAAKSALSRAHAGMALEYHRYGHVFYTISPSLVSESPMVLNLNTTARESYEKRLFFPAVSQEELNSFIDYLVTSRPKAISGTEIMFGGLI